MAVQYTGEEDIHYVMDLVDNELSEPYSIFTYRSAAQLYCDLGFSSTNPGHISGHAPQHSVFSISCRCTLPYPGTLALDCALLARSQSWLRGDAQMIAAIQVLPTQLAKVMLASLSRKAVLWCSRLQAR